MPHYETLSDVCTGEIRVDFLATPDEYAAFDKGLDVERIDNLYGQVQDEITLGLQAIKTNLEQKFGTPQVQVWVKS